MARPKPLMPSPEDTEQQFYEALQRGDIEKLMAVWSDDDEIFCMHPGGSRLVGASAIRSAYETIFTSGVVEVYPERVRRVVTQSSAAHSVLERVQLLTEDGLQAAWLVATNVYVKTSLGWRMVARHVSPGTVGELPEMVETPAVLH